MKKEIVKTSTAFILAAAMAFPLARCGTAPVSESTDTKPAVMQETSLPMESTLATEEPTISTADTTIPTEATPESTVPPTTIPPEEEKDEFGLTEQQRNSFSMILNRGKAILQEFAYFDMDGKKVFFKDGGILLLRNHSVVDQCTVAEFSQRPNTMFQRLLRSSTE